MTKYGPETACVRVAGVPPTWLIYGCASGDGSVTCRGCLRLTYLVPMSVARRCDLWAIAVCVLHLRCCACHARAVVLRALLTCVPSDCIVCFPRAAIRCHPCVCDLCYTHAPVLPGCGGILCVGVSLACVGAYLCCHVSLLRILVRIRLVYKLLLWALTVHRPAVACVPSSPFPRPLLWVFHALLYAPYSRQLFPGYSPQH